MNTEKNKPEEKKKENTEETDPQENMEGPVSSIVRALKKKQKRTTQKVRKKLPRNEKKTVDLFHPPTWEDFFCHRCCGAFLRSLNHFDVFLFHVPLDPWSNCRPQSVVLFSPRFIACAGAAR